jgi:hypothetical protein
MEVASIHAQGQGHKNDGWLLLRPRQRRKGEANPPVTISWHADSTGQVVFFVLLFV